MSGLGMMGSVGIALQTSYQASNVASLRSFPVISETLEHTIESMVEGGMYQRFAEGPRHKGAMQVAGGLEFEPQPHLLGLAAYLVCGSSQTSFTGSIATHKFRPRLTSDWDEAISLPAATILVDRDVGSSMAYFGCCADQLKLDLAQGALLKGSLAFVGGFFGQLADVAPVYPVERPFVFNVASVSWGGVAAQFVRSLSLTVRNQLKPEWTLNGSATPALIKRSGPVQVSGRLVLLFQSNSLMPDFTTPTQRQLLVTLTSDVASPARLVIDVPKARPTTYAPQLGGPGLIELPMDFVGEIDTTSNYVAEFTVVNSVVGYP